MNVTNPGGLYLVPDPEAIEICDTTRLRHLGLVAARDDRWELIIGRQGLTVPRAVADPDDPAGTILLDHDQADLSELAGAERHFYAQFERDGDLAALTRGQYFEKIRRHPDLRVVDPDRDEQDDIQSLAARARSTDPARRVILGPGERAVLAIASRKLSRWLRPAGVMRLSRWPPVLDLRLV